MGDKVSYLYLRLSAGARHSQVSMAASVIETMLGTVRLENDIRDNSVYCIALPEEIDDAQATRIISALVTEPYIDEAWRKEAAVPIMRARVPGLQPD